MLLIQVTSLLFSLALITRVESVRTFHNEGQTHCPCEVLKSTVGPFAASSSPKSSIDDIGGTEDLVSKPAPNLPPGYKHRTLPSYRSASRIRNAEPSPEEKEERINRSFARMMQFMTFFGHLDNYFTDKASGFIKVVGRAMENDDEEEHQDSKEIWTPKGSPSRISASIRAL